MPNPLRPAGPLRIAVDARALREPAGGLRRYAAELLPALAAAAAPDRLTLWSDGPGPLPARVLRFPRTTLLRPFWEELRLAPALREGCDLLFSPTGAVPARARCPVVATLHDLAFLEQPELLRWQHRLYWWRLARGLARAAAVVAVSGATRDEAVRLLGLPPERIHVVHSGVAACFRPLPPAEADAARARHRLPETFVLAVAPWEPRKNLDVLAAAVGRLPVPLVVVGRRDAAAERRHPRLRALGALPDEELAALLGAATVVAVPSLDEGFGLPLLEGMACGAACAAAAAGALPEVAGGAALLLPPRDVDAWAQGLADLLADAGRRRELGERARQRAAGFTWAATARSTRDVLRAVANRE